MAELVRPPPISGADILHDDPSQISLSHVVDICSRTSRHETSGKQASPGSEFPGKQGILRNRPAPADESRLQNTSILHKRHPRA